MDPLPRWARSVALAMGTVGMGLGSYAVFASDNQAGTALLLLVGVVLVLLGLQGTPLRRLGGGEYSVELANIRTRLAAAAKEVARDGSPEAAAAVADVVRAIDPSADVPSPSLLYEDAVLRAIERAGGTLDPSHTSGAGDRGVDARVSLPSGKINVEIKYRSRGALGGSDIANAHNQLRASGFEGGHLLVTNAPLSAAARSHNFETGGQPGGLEVITWNDERDDDLLARALARNARS